MGQSATAQIAFLFLIWGLKGGRLAKASEIFWLTFVDPSSIEMMSCRLTEASEEVVSCVAISASGVEVEGPVNNLWK